MAAYSMPRLPGYQVDPAIAAALRAGPTGRYRPPARPRPPARTAPPAPRPPAYPSTSQPGQPADPVQARAQALAMAQLQPLIAEIQRQIAAQGTAGTAAIQGATSRLADAYSSYLPQVTAGYQQAEGKTAAVDQALADRLSGQGSSLSADLEKTLGQAGQATAPAAIPASVGQGASAAGFAKGAASLEALIAEEAAARRYGAALPGIAQGYGLQAVSNLEGRLASDASNRIGSLTAGVPAATAGFYDTLTRQQQQGQARYDTLAANRTAQTGYVWVSTQHGIKPLTDGRGRKVPTASYQAQQATGLARTQSANTAASRATTAALSETDRHAEAVARNQQAQKTLTERVRHNQATEQNQSASQAERTAARQARERDQKALQALRRRAEKERERHDRVTEKKKAKASASTNPFGLPAKP